MSLAAYKAEVRVGGAPVAVLAEITQALGAGPTNKIFRITNPLRRIIDSSTAVIVKDATTNGVVVPLKINYLEGVFVFAAAVPNGIKVDYSYIPVSFVGGSKEYSLELGGDLLDDTAFHDANTNNPGYRTRQHGLNDVSVSFSRFDDLVKTLRNAKMAKQRLLISIRPGGAESKWKATGWFINENVSASGDVSALEEESFSYQLAGDIATTFSFITDYVTLDTGTLTDADLIANYFQA